ncbi:chromosome-associated kinesin KIF4-like [Ruditapes philippinarum]|uniref:chromosome-associated kinesin KIF4-like n=1 Tax=Ruditapes philippinarum TaxID=129788 RepID=UPI00295BB92E|nr:chromosome-associated kinesin KIF4-like [Ruditapes philippinarum]
MPESISIKVVGRCRPLTAEENKKGAKVGVSVAGDKVIVQSGKTEQSFSCDGAYPPEYRNSQIYKERVEPLVQRAMEGYNVTVLAFGAAGSGKSMLMTGTDDDPGMIPSANRSLFEIASKQGGKDFMISVSYVEIVDEKMTDLLNPHTNTMNIRQHPTKGIFVDGLSEIIVKSADEIAQYFEQGTRARKMGATDMRSHRPRANAVFTVIIEQREKQSSKVGVRSVLHMVDCAGNNASGLSDPEVLAGVQGLQNVLMALGGPRKGSGVPYRDSKITRYLQESLGGNAISLLFALVSPLDKSGQENTNTMQVAQFAKNVKNRVKLNLDETNEVIADLREEIGKLRDKIASTSEPSKEDVLKMEDLVKDLQIAKKQTWDEKQRASGRFEEERKVNLANKGILEWVTDNMKKGSKELQEKVQMLQKEKDQIMAAYKEKRAIVDKLKAELQNKIAQYSKFAEKGKASEAENKALVTAIHKLKEQLRVETEKLKTLKQQLVDVQERQQLEKEGAKAQMASMKGSAELRQKVELEERKKLEESNKSLVAEELERTRLDIDAEKAEIQMRAAEGKKYSTKEGEELEIKVAEMKAEKSVVTLQLQCIQQEKARLAKELEEIHRLHKDEMELQQLQHYQTFRNYREMFEEQKVAIEQRYRHLLDDSIQDAVFLSARNNELVLENQELRLQLNEMKDVVTKLGGRLPSSVENPL